MKFFFTHVEIFKAQAPQLATGTAEKRIWFGLVFPHDSFSCVFPAQNTCGSMLSTHWTLTNINDLPVFFSFFFFTSDLTLSIQADRSLSPLFTFCSRAFTLTFSLSIMQAAQSVHQSTLGRLPASVPSGDAKTAWGGMPENLAGTFILGVIPQSVYLSLVNVALQN